MVELEQRGAMRRDWRGRRGAIQGVGMCRPQTGLAGYKEQNRGVGMCRPQTGLAGYKEQDPWVWQDKSSEMQGKRGERKREGETEQKLTPLSPPRSRPSEFKPIKS